MNAFCDIFHYKIVTGVKQEEQNVLAYLSPCFHQLRLKTWSRVKNYLFVYSMKCFNRGILFFPTHSPRNTPTDFSCNTPLYISATSHFSLQKVQSFILEKTTGPDMIPVTPSIYDGKAISWQQSRAALLKLLPNIEVGHNSSLTNISQTDKAVKICAGMNSTIPAY